jgi:hypothetical protein
MSSKTKLEHLHEAAKVARERLAAGDTEGAIVVLDAAIVANDPALPREPTPLGARILGAARELGMDVVRIVNASTLPTAAITRLVYNTPKKPRVEELSRVAAALGVELAWLTSGTEPMRTTPIPPGTVVARSLGASEAAIRSVLERDGVERTEEVAVLAFLEETKRLKALAPESTKRVR